MQRIENDKQNRKELAKTTTKGKKAGKVTYLFDETKKKMTDIQKTSVKGLKILAEATGVNIVLYDSYIDESGKRVFKDENGNVKEAPNGYYKSSTSTIYLDINAGENAEGTMLFTASHELTHFIRQWSEDKFQILADFLMKEYGKKGISVNDLIQEQIDKSKRNGEELSYDEAYEEVIADSCQQMLTDGKVLKKLAQTDKTLFEKVKSFINDLVSKIKSAYAKLKPDSKEARYVSEMVDAVEEIQNLFTEALTDASENYKSSPKNIDSNRQKEYNNSVKFSNKKSRYDEFNTNVMQWAYSASTNPGDIKVFNRNGKDFALMKATENGAIELKSGKYEVVKEYEQRYKRPDNSVYVYTDIVRSDERGDTANNGTIGNKREQIEGSGQTGSKGLQSDGTGSNEHLRTGDRGVNDSDEIKYSFRNSNEKYTEKQYNSFGWASYNNIITPAERETLLSYYSGHKHNDDKFPITPKGETVLHASTVHGLLMYVRGNIKNPEITKIVLISASEKDTSAIERWILENEYEQIPQPYKSIESYYGEEVLSIYRKQDFASYREYSFELEGRSGKTSNSFSGEKQNGRGSSGDSKRSSGKSEIKYSQRDPAYLKQKEKVDAILEKENAKLREDNEHLKELLKIQGTLTHGQKFTKTSVEAAAGHLMKTANARGNKSEFVPLLNDFYMK